MQRVCNAIARHRTAHALRAVALPALLCLFLCLAIAPTRASAAINGSSPSTTAVCIIARVTAQVTTGADQGTWQLDRTASDTARGNVTTLCTSISRNDRLSVTLAVSPLLVERWTEQAAEGDTAASTCMDALGKAIATGRLELVSLGYGDPDLTRLGNAGYDDDIIHQYGEAEAALPSGRSTGTVPYGLAFDEGAVGRLVESGITWAAIDSSLLSGGTAQPRSGLFTCLSDRNLSLLAIDVDGAGSFSSGTAADASTLLQRLVADDTPLPCGIYSTVVELSATGDAANLVDHLTAAAGVQGFRLDTATDAVAQRSSGYQAPPNVSIEARIDDVYPPELSSALQGARTTVASLRSMLYSSNTTYDEALRGLLVSESAGFADPDAAAGLARSVAGRSDRFFRGLSVNAEDMTLAGEKGTIPFVITNDTDAALEVTIAFTPGEGLTVADPDYAQGYTTVLYSGENTFSVPVSCATDHSTLGIALTTGDTTIAQNTINVHTSSINRVTLVICALILIGVCVCLLRRRNRRKAVEVR